MEPNAGDIYGLQQQQRRMSKSNSRAHRMSVATGIRLIQKSEIYACWKIFQWKNSKNMLQYLEYENPSKIVKILNFAQFCFSEEMIQHRRPTHVAEARYHDTEFWVSLIEKNCEIF